jgi:hypothetical protein
MPVVGLQVLHLGSFQLGLLFTSMGAGSVIGAVFVINWLRARFSPDSVRELQEVSKEVVGIHVRLIRSLFGDGIPRKLLLPVSPVKLTSAPSLF